MSDCTIKASSPEDEGAASSVELPTNAHDETKRLFDERILESQTTGYTPEIQNQLSCQTQPSLPKLPRQQRSREEKYEQLRDESSQLIKRAFFLRSHDESQVLSSTACAEKYLSVLGHDVDEYIDVFTEHEMMEASTIGVMNKDRIRTIHRSILTGDLPYRYKNDAIVSAAIDRIHQRVEDVPKQPRIYANYLVHLRSGRSLSPRQMKKLVDTAGQYLHEDGLAEKVDGAIGRRPSRYYTHRGGRRYMGSKSSGDYCDYPCRERVYNLGVLCRALKRRCDAVPGEQWDEPMPGSFAEFGYSASVTTRLRQHESHASSNYLMNLFEAICKVELGAEFGFERFVIYHIPSLDLVELSEMYWTRAGQGYSKNGGGCSHAAAGLSTASRKDFSAEQYDEFWEYSESQPFVKSNVDLYKSSVKQLVDDCEAKVPAIRAENDDLQARFDEYQEKCRRAQSLVDDQSREMSDLSDVRDVIDRRMSVLKTSTEELQRALAASYHADGHDEKARVDEYQDKRRRVQSLMDKQSGEMGVMSDARGAIDKRVSVLKASREKLQRCLA